MASLRNTLGVIWGRPSGSAIEHEANASKTPKSYDGNDDGHIAMTRKLTPGGPYVPPRRRGSPGRRKGDEALCF